VKAKEVSPGRFGDLRNRIKENAFKVFSEAVAKTQPARVERRVKHAKGHYVWLETAGDFLINGKGEASPLLAPSSMVGNAFGVSSRT